MNKDTAFVKVILIFILACAAIKIPGVWNFINNFEIIRVVFYPLIIVIAPFLVVLVMTSFISPVNKNQSNKSNASLSKDNLYIKYLNIGVKNKKLFEEKIAKKVIQYIKAINDNDINVIKDICSKKIADKTIKALNQNKQEKAKLIIEDINLINCITIDVIESENPSIEAKVIMSINEKIHRENTASNEPQPEDKVYRVILTKKDSSTKDCQCDKCGAELSILTEKCPYCRTQTNFFKQRSWFISFIEELRQ